MLRQVFGFIKTMSFVAGLVAQSEVGRKVYRAADANRLSIRGVATPRPSLAEVLG